MKTENLARGLKLLALECQQDKELQTKLWDLRRELIAKRILKTQAENIEKFKNTHGHYLGYSEKEMLFWYIHDFNVSKFVAQHCINHILGVGK